MSRFAAAFGWVPAVLLVGCASTQDELERVAKDWCMTIRASQVLPVYPLSEDVQPGDVFVVPTTLQEQARIYEEKGFLPLDQRVTRLQGLPYAEFYRTGLSSGSDAEPLMLVVESADGTTTRIAARRAAFPSYNFEASRSGGLKLALPIQGVPTGLGIMGAKKARGTVTIRDAYTYGIDSESLIGILQTWWSEREEVRSTLADVVRQVREPVFLRVVTRVYLTGGVTVSLANLSTGGVGVDAGNAPGVELIDLSVEDPGKAQASTAAYAQVLQALSGNLAAATPGGSFRFTQASQRAVTLDEDFDRPLVIGYRGFDVKVFADGSLSAPIPSFATLRGELDVRRLSRGTFFVPGYGADASSALLDAWIDADDSNYDLLQGWIAAKKRDQPSLASLTPSALIYDADQADLRAAAIEELGVEPQEP